MARGGTVCFRLYNADVVLSPLEAERLRAQFDALRELFEYRFAQARREAVGKANWP